MIVFASHYSTGFVPKIIASTSAVAASAQAFASALSRAISARPAVKLILLCPFAYQRGSEHPPGFLVKPECYCNPLPLVCLLGAFIGQIVATAAAEVLSPRRQAELADPPVARYPVDGKRTGEPPAFPAQRRIRRLQAYWQGNFGFVPVSVGNVNVGPASQVTA